MLDVFGTSARRDRNLGYCHMESQFLIAAGVLLQDPGLPNDDSRTEMPMHKVKLYDRRLHKSQLTFYLRSPFPVYF